MASISVDLAWMKKQILLCLCFGKYMNKFCKVASKRRKKTITFWKTKMLILNLLSNHFVALSDHFVFCCSALKHTSPGG